MFAPELAAELRDEVGGLIVLAIHFRGYRLGVFYYNGKLGVMETELRSIVQVGGTNDSDAVISYQDLQSVSMSFSIFETWNPTFAWIYSCSVT